MRTDNICKLVSVIKEIQDVSVLLAVDDKEESLQLWYASKHFQDIVNSLFSKETSDEKTIPD